MCTIHLHTWARTHTQGKETARRHCNPQKWGSNTTQPHRGGCWPLPQQHSLSLSSRHSIALSSSHLLPLYFLLHHSLHPRTPYHTSSSVFLPREVCSSLCSTETRPFPFTATFYTLNLPDSKGKFSSIHPSYLSQLHPLTPPCREKEKPNKK